MTIFMSTNDLMNTVERIRAEMRNKRSYGRGPKADEDYMGCISMLESCLATGEIPQEMVARIEDAIAEFNLYVGIGIIVNGKFCPIPPSQAARFDIRPYTVISANRFPVVKSSDVASITRGLTPLEIDERGWRWDEQTKSLLSSQFFYRRYPAFMMPMGQRDGISQEAAREMGIEDLWLQQFHSMVGTLAAIDRPSSSFWTAPRHS